MTQWQRHLARGLCKIMSMHSARALEELTEAKCFLKQFERQSRWRGNTPRFPGPTQICFLGTTVSGSGNCMNRKKLMPSMSANGQQMSTRVRGKMRFLTLGVRMFPKKCPREELIWQANLWLMNRPKKKQYFSLYYIYLLILIKKMERGRHLAFQKSTCNKLCRRIPWKIHF